MAIEKNKICKYADFDVLWEISVGKHSKVPEKYFSVDGEPRSSVGIWIASPPNPLCLRDGSAEEQWKNNKGHKFCDVTRMKGCFHYEESSNICESIKGREKKR